MAVVSDARLDDLTTRQSTESDLETKFLDLAPVLGLARDGLLRLIGPSVEHWVDDFWGSYAWDVWESQIRKALPSGPWCAAAGGSSAFVEQWREARVLVVVVVVEPAPAAVAPQKLAVDGAQIGSGPHASVHGAREPVLRGRALEAIRRAHLREAGRHDLPGPQEPASRLRAYPGRHV